ncbi:MAG: enoyl-CoA hydratase-related protein [Gemmatimonadales bacterium]|jgi:enoyl-CoA hydratase
MSDVLQIEKLAGRVALLTFNRPDKMNALNAAVRKALVEALDDLRNDDDVRVVVLTGAGDRAFIAGADIGEFKDAGAVEQYRSMQEGNIYSALEHFPKPVIAMINGYCLGGGCELSMACDIRVASSKAKLGQPEINLGIIPGGGGTQRLPRLVGEGQAMRLIMTGELIGAEEAARIGLVEKVFEADELREQTLSMARSIASRSPIALQAAKESILAARRMPLDAGLEFERAWFGLLFSTEDKNEGVEAFLQKREPKFTGA